MTAMTSHRIARHALADGRYRYTVDGEVLMNHSRVLYTHASTYSVAGSEPVRFHKTEAAAAKATGEAGWTKTSVVAIQAL